MINQTPAVNFKSRHTRDMPLSKIKNVLDFRSSRGVQNTKHKARVENNHGQASPKQYTMRTHLRREKGNETIIPTVISMCKEYPGMSSIDMKRNLIFRDQRFLLPTIVGQITRLRLTTGPLVFIMGDLYLDARETRA